MSAILTRDSRIQNIYNFVRSIASTTSNKDLLYMFIGRSSIWPTADSNGNEIVPTPIDKLTSNELTTRSNIIGMKRVADTDVTHVIPRINWTTGTAYTAWDANDVDIFTKNFYVITDDFNVYKCIVKGGGNSSIKPTGTSTSNLVLGDGYTWKYMLTVSTSDVLNFLTDDWIPIPEIAPSGSGQEAVQNAASYSTGQPLGGHGSNAVHELGAFYMMIHCKLQNSEGSVLPTNVSYRQIGLWLNPLLSDSNGSAASGSVYAVASLNTLSGRVMYVENRSPVARGITQTEDLKVVISF